MKHCLISLLLLCLFGATGCKRKTSHHATPGMYYWKTVYAPTAYEQGRWRELGCRRIYVRCFDVVQEAGAIKPAGIIRNLESADSSLELVPVVFITQEAIRKITPEGSKALAGNIASLLGALFAGHRAPDEVQIDCDWTATTQAAYFGLLRMLREELFFKGKVLSCTIRLHQVKYRLRTGVPPADRGLLMCYNMGNIRQAGAHNSILDVKLAENYLADLKRYPLSLDVALPLFGWCLQFREGRLIGILRDVAPEQLRQAPGVFRQSGNSLFSCSSDSVWMGYPFRAGDIVRTEEPSREDILAMATFTARRIRNDSLRVMLFQSDSLTLSKHPHDELEAILSAYD